MKPTTVKIIILILILSLMSGDLKAQNKSSQRAELIGYNIGFGMATTVIGSLINKPKHTKAWPYIKRALWQGALGGTLQYCGKSLTYQVTRTGNDWWGWGSKIVHSAGTSICINAAMNNPFGQYWVLDYGPARLNFDIIHGRVKCQPQFNIMFLYDLYICLDYGRLDWGQSIKSGTVIFQSADDHIIFNQNAAIGVTFFESIILSQTATSQIKAHELVHAYQVNEYRIIGTYFKPSINKINNRTIKTLFRYINIELPYNFIIYTPFFNMDHYFRNPFEFEAQFFSTNEFVIRD